MFLFIVKVLSKLFFVKLTPIVSVGTFIKNKEGKILFMQLSYLKGLGLPGGMIESGENAEDAILREVKEETGLMVTESKYLWSTNSFFAGNPTLSLFFSVESTGEPKDSEEGSLLWLNSIEASGKMAYPAVELALGRYVESEKN